MKSGFASIASDIKLAHSIFALPFAILGACIAAGAPLQVSTLWLPLVLVVVAMVFARTAAMLANRILDADLDKANPRTAGRAIPSGRLSRRAATTAFVLASLGFLVVCVLFGALLENWWPAILGVPVLLWICAYGFFKRFTAFCHLWLGASLALSPLAAAIAINPEALTAPTIWLLAAMVLGWVAGFDVIYALQDIDVDRRDGLHSIPAKFGPNGALWISRALHLAAVILLVGVWKTEPAFGWAFGGAVALVAVLLAFEHATVKQWGTTKMALTFMMINGVVSIVVGVVGVVELAL
jgi:4-hydroxybenzoate polyprenyltransferase